MRKTVIDVAITVVFVAVFLYVMALINLFKATGKIEFNVLASPAFPDLLLFAALVTPVLIIWRLVRARLRGRE